MSVADPEWTESNRALLVAEFARLKALLQGAPTEAAPRTSAPPSSAPPAIDELAANFELSPFERDLPCSARASRWTVR